MSIWPPGCSRWVITKSSESCLVPKITIPNVSIRDITLPDLRPGFLVPNILRAGTHVADRPFSDSGQAGSIPYNAISHTVENGTGPGLIPSGKISIYSTVIRKSTAKNMRQKLSTRESYLHGIIKSWSEKLGSVASSTTPTLSVCMTHYQMTTTTTSYLTCKYLNRQNSGACFIWAQLVGMDNAVLPR